MAEYKAKRPRRRPTHPGRILREEVVPDLGITVVDLAKALDVSRQTLHRILAEEAPVTPLMAAKLAAYLGTTPELWATMQVAVDLWDVREKHARELKRVASQAA